VFKKMRERLSESRRSERGVSLTVEVLIFLPLGIAFVGFLLNSAFHYATLLYVQNVVNNGATYTAAAGGNFQLPYVPNGGFNMTPSQYVVKGLNEYPFVASWQDASCGMISGQAIANGVSRCVARYRTLVFPTDPISARAFGQQMVAVGEDIAQTGSNPNVQ
jgi:hypothetical protein